MLKARPLERVFPEYTGGLDVEAAKFFMAEKFVALVPKESRPLCVSYTRFLEDETSMARVVLKGVEYQMNGSAANDKRLKPASYFIMGKDGIPRYDWDETGE